MTASMQSIVLQAHEVPMDLQHVTYRHHIYLSHSYVA